MKVVGLFAFILRHCGFLNMLRESNLVRISLRPREDMKA